ncbi:MAG: dihydrodipicolinate synthase family protein, partial [Phycisphaerae bacterium]|nr:dihydrodipicolinate synthase family protein [Phycisphaerae bacterium]
MTRVAVTIPGRPDPLTIDDDLFSDLRRRHAGAPDVTPTRLVYAATHVVMTDAYAHADPGLVAEHIDWPATLDLRRRVASHGFGVAEAMDTAQRFEVGWPIARRLIEETGRLAFPHGFVAGAGVDHRDGIDGPDDLVAAVVEQGRLIRAAGGIPIVLPMAWLPQHDADADAYVDVYRRIAATLGGPLFIHWLGPMFAPDLAGYFPGESFERVMDADPLAIRGAKLSMLDAELETRLRRRLLPRNQILLTGDDLHFGGLIEGSGRPRRWTRIVDRDVAVGDFSHGLLGIFDAISAPAGIALRCLDHGDHAGYGVIMRACEQLGRVIFEPPVHQYKVGLAFVHWLNGHQTNAMLPNRLDRERSRDHLVRVAAAAAAAGAIGDA